MTAAMKDHQVQMLAHLACASRPPGSPRWDEPGVVAPIRVLLERGFGIREVIDRVLAHAWDTTAKTPGTILTPKARPVIDTGGPVFPQRKGDNECALHIGKPAGTCSLCAADRLVGDTTPPITPREDPPNFTATGRRIRHTPVRQAYDEHLAADSCDEPDCHYHRFAAGQTAEASSSAPRTETANERKTDG